MQVKQLFGKTWLSMGTGSAFKKKSVAERLTNQTPTLSQMVPELLTMTEKHMKNIKQHIHYYEHTHKTYEIDHRDPTPAALWV